MSIAAVLLVPGSLVFLVALLVLGSWLEARLAELHPEPQLVPVPVGSDVASSEQLAA